MPMYGRQMSPVTTADVYRYLAIIFAMGAVHTTNCGDLWSNNPPLGSAGYFNNIMPRERFKEVKRVFSVGNPDAATNATNKLAKVEDFLNLVRKNIQRNYRPMQDMALDETSIQCGHRYARVSYRAQTHKKRKDFIKVIAVHECETAYCWDFFVDKCDHAATHDLTLRVLSSLPPVNHIVACDRFYSSPKTFEALKEKHVYAYGTLARNRGAPKSFTREKFPDGHIKFAFSKQLSLTAWKDSGDVLFLSSFHGTEMSSVNRRVKGVGIVNKPAPLVVVYYNDNMVACDQFNAIMQARSCHQIHQHRWYTALIYYALDVLLIDSCVYYSRLSFANVDLVTNKEFHCMAVDHFVTKADQFVLQQRGSTRRAPAHLPVFVLL
jgi:hypothetical protein